MTVSRAGPQWFSDNEALLAALSPEESRRPDALVRDPYAPRKKLGARAAVKMGAHLPRAGASLGLGGRHLFV